MAASLKSKKVLIRSTFLNFEGNPHYISEKIILDCLLTVFWM